jgi:hypothetical protein
VNTRLVNTAELIGNAMTDYLLAAGTAEAPAARAPQYMAAWLEGHGYRIVRSPGALPADRSTRQLVGWHRGSTGTITDPRSVA